MRAQKSGDYIQREERGGFIRVSRIFLNKFFISAIGQKTPTDADKWKNTEYRIIDQADNGSIPTAELIS